MDPKDPLFDTEDDRTVHRPIPGRRRSQPSSGKTSRLNDGRATSPFLASDTAGIGQNPFIKAATDLLSLVAQLRVTAT